MIQTIRVASIHEAQDLKGIDIVSELHNSFTKIRTARLYRLEGIDTKTAHYLARKLFCESINQVYSLNEPVIKKASQTIEIAYKPGVMNPEAASILKAARDLKIDLKAADSSWEYYFFGDKTKPEVEKIIYKLRLLNDTVEYIVSDKPKTLLIKGKVGKTIIIPIRTLRDEELLAMSKDTFFLNLEEMKVIQDYFKLLKRDPTDCELETLAQTWSEHCAHKTFKAHLVIDGKKKQPLIKRIQKEALKHNKNIISAFVDNSGVMEFYDSMSICGKVETHNSPSAIEPYGGAMTGSGGVFRDILGTGLGAKTIVSTDMFCFARPELPLKNLPQGCLPPEYLLKRVVAGVKDYGNRMGIPTNNGSIHFHDDFRAKPSVIVGAYGIIPTKKARKGIVRIGDRAIAVGGKTGRDGIHGATFSSAEMTDRTISVNSSAVQIGNPIEEKRMCDAILEARDKNLISAVQDCGAGGFSSAIGEMGEDTGVTVDLSKVPLKYAGLSPWEIWVSESQERMVLAVAKKNIKAFMNICRKYNVETAELGVFDGSKKLNIYFGKQLVCALDMAFIFHGLPQRTMVAKHDHTHSLKKTKVPLIPKTQKAWHTILSLVLSHGNICSKEPIVRRYDHTVQGTNSMQPYLGEHMNGPTDAAVIRPMLGKSYGMIVSHGLNPILNNIDAYWGSIWASTEALSNYVAVGGDYLNASLINNYIWPFPDAESLWSLDRSVDGVVDVMKTFKIPVISGKDSLSSTYRGPNGNVIKIPPVLCMSVFGKIPDVSKTISSDLKKHGSSLYMVGIQDLKSLGGSTYYDVSHILGTTVPHVNLHGLPRLFKTIYKNIQKGAILSCHDISEGGLITTLFEMCVGGNMGAQIDISKIPEPDNFLFNETAGCFVVEIENDSIAKNIFKGIPYMKIGETSPKKTIAVKQKEKNLFEIDLEPLKKVWQAPMKKIFP